MSRFWNNHPEEYEEILRKAAVDWVFEEMKREGFDEPFDGDVVRMVVDALWEVKLPETYHGGAFKQWTHFSNLLIDSTPIHYITSRESDFWGRYAR